MSDEENPKTQVTKWKEEEEAKGKKNPSPATVGITKEDGQMIADDFKKYTHTEKDGSIIMDSGLQKQKVGQVKKEKKDYFVPESSGRFKVDVDLFVDEILNTFPIKTIHGTKNDSVYVYDEGIWKKKGVEIIKTFSEKELNENCKNNLVKEILEKVKRKTAIDPEEFEITPINLIPLENGVYNLETNKLQEHDSKNFFKFKIPITFNKEATCSKFLKFLDETLYPEDIEVIKEWFGFCLYRKYFLKKGMIWVGEKDTGKTTLLNILEGLIGKENCSGLSLQNISQSEGFKLKFLHNKQLNSHDDLSFKDLNDSGGFKIATGGGTITGEHKFGDLFKFRNHAKLLFACNKIPSVKELDDDAYFSRWIPIQFDNQIEEKHQDPNMEEKCLKESSGILNWALEGLKKILENKKFCFDKKGDEVKAIMCRSGNPIMRFVQDRCYEEENFWISKEDLYEKYCQYTRAEGLQHTTMNMFSRNLKRNCAYVVNVKGIKRGWRNLKPNDLSYEKLGK